MRKRLVLSLDAGSFPIGSPVAARLGAVSGTVDIDVDAVLLMIAYVTRPPAIYGFSLADAWAWLRYRQAIARTRRLRLKAEWTDLDQHQKAVLSDEMGVGFTTYFLQGVFDVRVDVLGSVQVELRLLGVHAEDGLHLGVALQPLGQLGRQVAGDARDHHSLRH